MFLVKVHTYDRGLWKDELQRAAVYWRQEKYALALDELRLALHTSTLIFDQGRPSVDLVEVMCRGAVLCQAIGEKGNAYQYLKYCVYIWEINYGPDYINVASVLNELAGTYRNQGDKAMSDLVLWGLLAIGEKKLGPGHLDLQSLYRTVYPTIKKIRGYSGPSGKG